MSIYDKQYLKPVELAAHLATYIGDPTAIRARTMDHFGRAPTVEQCRNLRNAYLERMEKARKALPCSERYGRFRCGHDQTDENTALMENGNGVCLTCLEVAEAKKKATAKRLEYKAPVKLFPSWYAPPIVTGARPRVTSETLKLVAACFKMSVGELIGSGRSRQYIVARTIAVMLFRQSGASYPQIGRWLGGRDHTTIINMTKRWHDFCKADPSLKVLFQSLGGRLPLDPIA